MEGKILRRGAFNTQPLRPCQNFVQASLKKSLTGLWSPSVSNQYSGLSKFAASAKYLVLQAFVFRGLPNLHLILRLLIAFVSQQSA